MSAPAENPVGKIIYLGTLLPSPEEGTWLEIRILEGLLEEYVPLSGGEISPVAVIVGNKVLYSCGNMDRYVWIAFNGEKLGWFLHDFSKEKLIERLLLIYDAMAVASEASGFFDLDLQKFDFDGLPETMDFEFPE